MCLYFVVSKVFNSCKHSLFRHWFCRDIIYGSDVYSDSGFGSSMKSKKILHVCGYLDARLTWIAPNDIPGTGYVVHGTWYVLPHTFLVPEFNICVGMLAIFIHFKILLFCLYFLYTNWIVGTHSIKFKYWKILCLISYTYNYNLYVNLEYYQFIFSIYFPDTIMDV